MKWQAVGALKEEEFPAADRPIINALKLPDRYMITGVFDSLGDFEARLQRALEKGIQLVQLRLKPDWLNKNLTLVGDIMQLASDLCQRHRAILMINVPDKITISCNYDGVHADSRKLQTMQQRPECEWFSVSCHTVQDMQTAALLGADFAVLSPVLATASHPGAKPLGWRQFGSMVEQATFPIYSLGGVGDNQLATAWKYGGQGVAAISAYW